MHRPLLQTAPLQAWPQLPQLSGSVVISTHLPEHIVGAAMGHVQTLLLQPALATVQSLVHDPQCFGSLVVSKQLPFPQSTRGAVHTQLPDAHEWFGAQTRQAAPQCWVSFCVS